MLKIFKVSRAYILHEYGLGSIPSIKNKQTKKHLPYIYEVRLYSLCVLERKEPPTEILMGFILFLPPPLTSYMIIGKVV